MSDQSSNSDERASSSLNNPLNNPSRSDVSASPVPGNLLLSRNRSGILSGNRSGTSTPEGEVESSLAYKGTPRHSAKSRQGKRKLKKKKEEAKVEADMEEDRKIPVVYLDITEENCKYTQTQTNFLDDTVDEIFDIMVDAKKNETSSSQTNLKWSELEEIVDRDVDNMGINELKGLVRMLRNYICGKKDAEFIYNTFKTETVEPDTPEDKKQDIPEVRLEEPVIVKTTPEDHDIVSYQIRPKDESEDSFDTNPDDSLTAPVKRQHALSDADGEADTEREKKVSIGGSDPPPPGSRRTSLAIDNSGRKRISSAHCIGNRRETLDMGQTVIDLFKAQGEEQKKEEPAILKYVGEKPNVSPSIITSMGEGWHEGLCQFCGKELLMIPTLEQIEDPALSEYVEYCCASFKYFINLFLVNQADDETDVEDEIIDVRPNAPYGSKKHRKAARERAADRQRERELEKQKAAAQQANLFSFARQMKTIQYSLASRKYMNEGWTILPSSPPPIEINKDDNLFQVEVNSTLLQTAGVLVNKTYDNGKPFLNIFPDGTGCCYYPSGHVAVMITSTEKGKYTYIVQTNKGYQDLEDSGLLAIFQANGNSICYYKRNQKIRTYINAFGGVELDPKGRKKKRWQWYMIKGHVHTPPFHPLCFSLNKYLSVRILNQQNIALSFSSLRRSVRFNVGAQLKALSVRNRSLFGADDPAEIYLSEKRRKIASILTNLHSAVRLPKSAREGPYPTTSQKKKEKMQKLVMGRAQLPPIVDTKQSVVIN